MKRARKLVTLRDVVAYAAPSGGIYVHFMPRLRNAGVDIFALLHAAKNWHVPEGIWRYGGSMVDWELLLGSAKREARK